jgi:hypothetical protein
MSKLSPSQQLDYEQTIEVVLGKWGLICYLCGKKHERRATLQIDYFNTPEAGGTLTPENMVPACKPCAKRRNQRELPTYWIQRIQEIEAEKSHIKTMSKDFVALWDLAAMVRYAPRITEDAPHAVEETGATDPVPNRRRPTRIYEHESLPLEDTETSGPYFSRPKDRQHGDIFIDCEKDVSVWDVNFVRKDKVKGAWVRMEKTVEHGTFPADWAENPAHEVYPPVDYARSITAKTPHAVDETGQKDEPKADPAVMEAARIAPDADTEVENVWFDGSLYWRELRYTHPLTGETTLSDEVFTPD